MPQGIADHVDAVFDRILMYIQYFGAQLHAHVGIKEIDLKRLQKLLRPMMLLKRIQTAFGRGNACLTQLDDLVALTYQLYI